MRFQQLLPSCPRFQPVDSAGGFGRTPNSLEISPGKHSVQLVLNGYKDQVGEILPRVGYKLAVEVSMEK